jgi:DNA polymerase-4/protein ImuB
VASAAVGEGKFVARAAATCSPHGAVTVVPPGGEPGFLAPLSTSFLPVSYETHRKLALYGLRTIGEVAALDIGPAQAQFGREGRRLWELARGLDREPFRPRERVEPVAGTLTMPAATVNSAALIIGARQLTGRLLRRPSMRYRMVRQLRLRMALLRGGSWERTLTFREPLGDEEGIVYVLKKLIEPLQLPGAVEEMTLEFAGLTSETGKQRSLLFAEQARRRVQLLAALRQLKTRYGGESQVAQMVEVEPWSRIPERRYALIDFDR